MRLLLASLLLTACGGTFSSAIDPPPEASDHHDAGQAVHDAARERADREHEAGPREAGRHRDAAPRPEPMPEAGPAVDAGDSGDAGADTWTAPDVASPPADTGPAPDTGCTLSKTIYDPCPDLGPSALAPGEFCVYDTTSGISSTLATPAVCQCAGSYDCTCLVASGIQLCSPSQVYGGCSDSDGYPVVNCEDP